MRMNIIKIVVPVVALLLGIAFADVSEACARCKPKKDEPTVTNNNNDNRNTNLNGNLNLNGNRNDNSNRNVNRNNNDNRATGIGVGIAGANSNSNSEANSNAEANSDATANAVNTNTNGQLQGQAQGQVSAAGAVSVLIDFNHIVPMVNKTNSELAEHADTAYGKMVSDIDSTISAITYEMAKKLGKDTKDFDTFEELMFEQDFRTRMLRKVNERSRGLSLMGSISLISDGPKATLAGMQGRAYVAAMEAGATHYLMINSAGMALTGSSAGLDLGSAGSHVMRSDGAAILGAGTSFGFSKSWSSNEMRPSVTIFLFFDTTAKIKPATKSSEVEYDITGGR